MRRQMHTLRCFLAAVAAAQLLAGNLNQIPHGGVATEETPNHEWGSVPGRGMRLTVQERPPSVPQVAKPAA